MTIKFYKHKETGNLYIHDGLSYSAKCKTRPCILDNSFKPVGENATSLDDIKIHIEGDYTYEESYAKLAESKKQLFDEINMEIPYELIKGTHTFNGKPIFKFIMKCPICGKELKTGCCYLTYPSSTEHECVDCNIKFEEMLASGHYITGYNTEEEIKELLSAGYKGERELYDNTHPDRWLRNNIDL